MTKKRAKHNWPDLLAYQQESGLTVADFCSVNKISPFLYLEKTLTNELKANPLDYLNSEPN